MIGSLLPWLVIGGIGSIRGALVGSVMFAGRAIGPLASVVALATRYQGARAAMAALERLMQLPPERDAQRQIGRAHV